MSTALDLKGRSLAETLADSALRISLAAHVEGALAGYVMARLDYGDFGRVEPVAVIDTIGVDPLRARQGIGYLPQEASIFRKLTTEENVLAILETRGWKAAEQRAHARELLEELGIQAMARQPAYTLSGGERRRLEICRALAAEPSFILLDEPFAGIDPIAVIDIQKIIAHLRDRGIGILITDHNVRETLKITDRAYILRDGNVFRSGTPRELASDPEVRRVYLGEGFRLDGGDGGDDEV